MNTMSSTVIGYVFAVPEVCEIVEVRGCEHDIIEDGRIHVHCQVCGEKLYVTAYNYYDLENYLQCAELQKILDKSGAKIAELSPRTVKNENGESFIHFFIGHLYGSYSSETETVLTCDMPNMEHFHECVENLLSRSKHLTEEMIGDFGVHTIMYVNE